MKRETSTGSSTMLTQTFCCTHTHTHTQGHTGWENAVDVTTDDENILSASDVSILVVVAFILSPLLYLSVKFFVSASDLPLATEP